MVNKCHFRELGSIQSTCLFGGGEFLLNKVLVEHMLCRLGQLNVPPEPIILGQVRSRESRWIICAMFVMVSSSDGGECPVAAAVISCPGCFCCIRLSVAALISVSFITLNPSSPWLILGNQISFEEIHLFCFR